MVVDVRDDAVEVLPGLGQLQLELLGAAAVHELPDVGADGLQGRHQLVVAPLHQRAVEGEEDADNVVPVAHWHGRGRPQPGCRGGGSARERRDAHVRHPLRRPGGPHRPGEADARSEPVDGAHRAGGETVAGPVGEEPELRLVRAAVPVLHVRPPQRVTESVDDLLGRLLGGVRRDQCARDGVLHVAQALGPFLCADVPDEGMERDAARLGHQRDGYLDVEFTSAAVDGDELTGLPHTSETPACATRTSPRS